MNLSTIYNEFHEKTVEIMFYFTVNNSATKLVETLYSFLTTTLFDKKIKEITKLELKTNEDIEKIKSFMILDMASTYYEYLVYLESIDFLDETDKDFKTYFENPNINQKNIFKNFIKDKDTSSHIIKRYIDYHFCNYVIRNYCLKLIVDQQKLSIIRRINPLALLKYQHAFDIDFITDYEMNIKYLVEMYKIELKNTAGINNFGMDFFLEKDAKRDNYEYDEEYEDEFIESEEDFEDEDYDELDDEHFNEDPIDRIYENITKKYIKAQCFNNHLTEIGKRNIGYIIGKVAESIEFHNINNMNTNLESNDILTILTDLDSEDAINLFITDLDFAIDIIDIFIDTYESADFEDFKNIHENVKEKGKTKIIEKINPYYEREKQRYQ